nr:undecaprenyl-phosphate glucose phosphotransferase [Desulfuromonadales bacterium]
AALLQSYIFQFAGLYEENAVRRLPAQLGRLAGAWSLLFVLLITVAFLTKTSATFSRGWTLIWFTSGLAGLGMTRLALHMRMQKWVRDG